MNRELLAAFDATLQEILTLLPAVHGPVAGLRPLEADSRWALLRLNAEDLAQRPLPVVTLLGPSGAGKSTIFRALTGLEVPAGGAERPMSYNCAVAMPPDFPEHQLAAMFPGMQLRRLEDPAEIKRPDLPRETLFFQTMPPAVAAHGDFLLADVPDFSTTCLENWEKAKLMLQRAEVVIFVVTRFSYADYQTVLYLARACAHAAHLACVFTMTDAEAAPRVWLDLVEQKAPHFTLRTDIPAEDEPRPFAECRADHQTRAAFLAQADVDFSPYSEAPQLEGIRALRAGAPPLADFLRGRNIARLMLTKRGNDLQQGLKLADETLAAQTSQSAELRRCRESIEAEFSGDSLDIVGRQLPLGEVLEVMLEQAQQSLPFWRRAVASMTAPVWRGIRQSFAMLNEVFSKPDQVRALRRDESELAELRDHADRLANRWRADHGRVIELPAERCSEALETLRESVLPEPDQGWQAAARATALEWVRAHPNRATLILNIAGAVTLMAGCLATVDLAVAGGGVHLTVWAAMAMVGVAPLAATLNALVQKLGLHSVLEKFQVEWKRGRNRQLRVFLHDRFARPLVLDALDRRLAALEQAPAAACRESVIRLRRLLGENLA